MELSIEWIRECLASVRGYVLRRMNGPCLSEWMKGRWRRVFVREGLKKKRKKEQDKNEKNCEKKRARERRWEEKKNKKTKPENERKKNKKKLKIQKKIKKFEKFEKFKKFKGKFRRRFKQEEKTQERIAFSDTFSAFHCGTLIPELTQYAALSSD